MHPTLKLRLAQRIRPTKRPPSMYQKWRDLLFLHWAVEPALIQQTLPPGLSVDTFEGKAYLGIVPFFMRDIRPRFLPSVPGISNFLETNLRTYAYDAHGTPGVWFYSLDANQRLAVFLARTFFKLPYFYARMTSPQNNIIPKGIMTEYTTWRVGTPKQLSSHFRYRGVGESFTAEPGSLEFFLTERYILFAATKKKTIATGQVFHTPYPLQAAQVELWDDSLVALAGFPRFQREPDHTLWSFGVDVDVYSLEVPVPTKP